MFKALKNNKGFSLIELLVGTVLAFMVSAAAMQFYMTQHSVWVNQYEVSNMQQNGRAAIDEIVDKIRVAGAGLPGMMVPIEAKNTNPDSITVRFIPKTGVQQIGQASTKVKTDPILVDRKSDFSSFSVGQKVYMFKSPSGPGEWFTVSNMVNNAGTGWMEIYHGGADLLQAPASGDLLLALNEVKYYVDKSDTTHPILKKIAQGQAPADFAEDIIDLQFVYTLSTGVKTSTPAANDSIVEVQATVVSRVNGKDETYKTDQGFRKRQYTTTVFIRNSGS